jgi:hypothetical protein
VFGAVFLCCESSDGFEGESLREILFDLVIDSLSQDSELSVACMPLYVLISARTAKFDNFIFFVGVVASKV